MSPRPKRSFYKPHSLLSRQQQWRRRNLFRTRHGDASSSRISGSNENESLSGAESNVADSLQHAMFVPNSLKFKVGLSPVHDHDVGDTGSIVTAEDDYPFKSQSPETLTEDYDGSDDRNLQMAESETTVYVKPSITQIIKNWAINEVNVPKSAVSRLLASLHSIHKELPKSFKTLLPSPHLLYEPMQEGRYVHFPNWTSCLKQMLLHIYGPSNNIGVVSYFLIVNVDGLPLFQHSPDFKLYPILLTIYGFKMRPLCAGIYCSQKSTERCLPQKSC